MDGGEEQQGEFIEEGANVCRLICASECVCDSIEILMVLVSMYAIAIAWIRGRGRGRDRQARGRCQSTS